MDKAFDERLSQNLADNVRYMRQQRGLTQARLASHAAFPRSTLANIEAGLGNPTLGILARLALALQVSIEEMLSTPRAQCQLYKKGELPIIERSHGKALISKLLPDPVPGMEIDRMELSPGARVVGVPHRPGTREYLYCEKGKITLWAAGVKFELAAGDAAAFQGDKRHSYGNETRAMAIGFSVVALVPIVTGPTQTGL